MEVTMDDGSPTLEVGFAINPTYGELAQLQNVMDSTEAKIVAEAAAIERATSGMIHLGGATAEVRSFGNAATAELAKAERASGRAEKAGEALSRQLERQINTFGMSKAAAAALAAEQNGLSELAERLRAQEAQLTAMRDQAAAVLREEAEATARLVREQNELAAAARAAAAAEQQMVREAQQLRAAIDPMFAAQQRFDQELDRAERLLAAGVISQREYAQATQLARDSLNNHARAVTGAGAAVDALTDRQRRATAAAGAHRNAMQGLSFQAQDAFTQISMGANPLSVLAIQGGQAAGQMANLGGKVGAVASFLIGPWGLAITAGLLALGALTKGLMDNKDASDKAAEGLARFASHQGDIKNFIDLTTGALVEQNRALIQNAILSRQAKIDANKEAVAKGQEAAFRAARNAASPVQTSIAPMGMPVVTNAELAQMGAINAVVKAAGNDVEKLDAGLQALARSRPDLAKTIKSISDAAAQSVLLARENRQLTDEIDVLSGKTTVFHGSLAKVIENEVAAAYGATNLSRAQAAYNAELAKATAQLNAHQIGEDEFRKRVIAATEAVNRARDADKALSAGRAASRSAARLDARLDRSADAVEAQIRNTLALADAYRVSGTEALIAEARVKAESQAIKAQGDVAAEVERQLRLAVAERVKNAAAATASLAEQARAQGLVNAMVAEGVLPAARAAQAVQDEIADLPLLAALQVAQQRGLTTEVEKATKALADQRAVRAQMRQEDEEGRFNVDMASGADRLAELREELRLVGATNAVRTEALAKLRATQEATLKFEDPSRRAEYIAQQVEIARTTEALAAAQRDLNDALNYTADRWDLIAQNVQNAGQGMAEAFGSAGRALGDLASIYADYRATQESAAATHDANMKAATDEAARQREVAKYTLATSTAQIGAYGDMAAAAKGFFKEGSDGYRALQKAEQVFRAIEFALSVRAMAQDAIETGSAVAKSAIRAASNGAEAVSKALAAYPPPANFAAAAAVVAALAAVGVTVAGMIGGSKNDLPASNTGTGTVLGDVSAKSESIKNAINALKEVDLLTNAYSRDMASSLRSIDSQIGNVASVIVRGGDINASAGVVEGFKPNTLGKLLGNIPLIGGFLSSLFGSKTSVTGSGLYAPGQSLGSILNRGFDAQTYSDIQKTKRFLGIKTGTSYSTQYANADAGLEQQFTLILRSFNDAIMAAAGPLGESTQAIQARLSSFVVSIGKIDLKDLTGAEIEEKLSAVFGAAADGMANAAFPGLARFQKVGEGAFETLVRVASTVEAVTNALGQLGAGAQGLGVDAKLALVDQFEDIGGLTNAVEGYFQAFYTKEEQAAAKLAQFGSVMTGLGLTMPETIAGFRQLVEAQDLNTEAGRQAYALLLQLAPAFVDLKSSMEGAKSAADILSERQDLQRKLLELQGDTAAIRALDLAKIDASNRALQEQVWALADAQEAAKAAQALADAWKGAGDSIMDEVRRIRGLSDTTGANTYASLLGQFNAMTSSARGGDLDAAKMLPQLSQALLNAAKDAATSRQELDRIRAMTAASLEATYGLINGAPAGGSSNASLLDSAAASQGANGVRAENPVASLAAELNDLKAEMAQMRADNNAGHAANAAANNKTAAILDRVTQATGGDALAVEHAA
jgi:hypothetical protein